MKLKHVWVSMFVAGAVFSARAIQTAGDLLVNIDVAGLSALPNYTTLGYWPNAGTLGSYFTNAIPGKGPIYQTNVGGVPAVTFQSYSADSIMTNLVAVPPSICGTETWSFETWVYNPSLSGTEVVFSWTARNGWPVAAPGSCVEFRYGADTGNAVEHNTYNMAWASWPNATMVPAVGAWHYVAATRDADGWERLYVDGQLRATTCPLIMRVRTDGMFTLGSTRNYAYTNTSTEVARQMENWSNYGYPFSGSLAKVRIHDGALTPSQVTANYLEERGAFGVSDHPDVVWSGAADQALAWEDPANWSFGFPNPTGRVVLATGGTTVVTTAVGDIGRFFPFRGTLVLSNNAAMVSTPWQMREVGMGNVSNALFNLEIRQGSFSMLDYTNGHTLICGQNGGRFNGVIGGGAGPAVLDGGRDVHIGSGNYTVARVTVEDGGSLYTSNGWIYVGVNGIADAKVTVNGGYVGHRKPGGYDLVVGHNNAVGVLEINSGMVAPSQDLVFTRDANSRCYGEVDLNGGVLQARRVYGQGTFSNTGTNILIFNGGTLRNRDSQTSFIQDMHWAWVRPGGAVFDILPNTAVVVPQALLTDPVFGDGGLTKSGNGILTLSGANTFTGDVTVTAGHLCFSNAAGLTAGYAGTIRVSAGGSVGYAKAGGLAELAGRVDPASAGSLTVYPINSAENLDLSAFPNLGLGFLSGVTYTGTYAPYAGQYVFSAVGTNNIYAQTIGGTASVTFNGDPAGSLDLTGDNSYSGGTTINGGMLCMRHANALGVAGGSPDIGIYNGAALKLNASGITAAIVSRIKPDSVGYIILGGACATLNLDLTGLPGVRVGTDVLTFNYGGTVTPDGNVYRLGGGRVPYASSYLGFVITNLTDNGATPRKLVLDGTGMVCPSNSTHSGGTVVSNSAALHLRWDRGLGAVPAAPDPSNLVVNGGVFRPGSATFSTHVNRGITVGPDGMVMHPNGGQTLTVLGNLHGSGAITNTDSGTVWLGGTGNTYSGKLAINSGTVGAGNGSTFSWNKDARIGGNGGTFGLYYNGNLSWSGAFGAAIGDDGLPFIGFRKTGSGTLTLDVPQSYSGSTTIDNGTLKIATTNAIPSGHNRGNVAVNYQNYNPMAKLDVNGYELDLNGLSGAGCVTDSTATATQVLIGNNNAFATFYGPVDENLTLTKIGTGAQIFNKGAVIKNMNVLSGTNSVAPDAKVTGTITVAKNAVLTIGGNTNEVFGLLGEYYDFNNGALRHYATVTTLVSLAKMNQVLDSFAPSTIAMSSVSNVFSFGYNGAFFQNRGDYRVIRWTGKFLAEQPGDYWFDSNSDDGNMVFVEGVTVLSNNFSQGFEPRNPNRVRQKVTLSEGWHDIVIGYYNGTGSYGLTVYMTPPGGIEAPLPQRLLRPPSAKVGALTGPNTSMTLFLSATAAAQVTPPADAVYEGLVTGSNALMSVEKGGAAKQTLRRLLFEGSAEVREGALELQGTGMFGAPVQTANAGLAVSNGATFVARSYDPAWPNAGLASLYYNIANFGNTTFTNLSLIANAFTLRVPDLVAGTHQAGVNFDMDPNSFFPSPYNTGTAVDFAAMYHGRIVIREAGTYTFMLASDDRSDMYLDGVAVVTNANSGATRSASTNLTAGSHEVLIPFQQGAGGYRIYANWTQPGGSSVPLPNAVLRPWTVQTGPLQGQPGAAVSLPDPGSYLRVNQSTNTVFDGGVVGVNGSELEKGGVGRLQLGGDNDAFLGSWFLSQGELWAGNGATAGTLGGSNIYVSGGATLVFNRSDDIVYRGDIAGRGTIRSAGAGRVTLAGDASGFAGTIDIGSGQSIYLGDSVATNALLNNEGLLGLNGGGTYLDASRITGAGRVGIENGATLSLGADQAAYANALVVSNGVLALAVTNAPSDWTLSKLTLQAGAGLEVVPSGLFGRFYDVPSGDGGVILSNAFLTLEAAEAYFSGKTPALTASTWLQGDGFNFGVDSTGTNGTALFPGKYRKPIGQANSNFAGFWKGKIRITDPGTYTFSTYSDDGSCIYIDGATVVNNAGSHGMQTRSGSVALTNGLHDIAIVFQQGGGGYGLTASVTLPGQTAAVYLPNRMLVARAEDTPAYSVAFSEIEVVNGPGAGTVAFTGPGTLKMTDLWIDTGSRLAVTGSVACAGSALTVDMPEEIPYGVTVVGDFTGTEGLNLSGVTLVSARPEGSLRYKDKLLYFARSSGSLIMLK